MLLFVLIFLIFALLWKFYMHYRRISLVMTIPGPKRHFLLGNIPILTKGIFRSLPAELPEVIIDTTTGIGKLYNGIYIFWIGIMPLICIYKNDKIEALLSSSVEIDKPFHYKLLHPWLGTGLLMSGDQKWHLRRKMLTPTFHYKILEEFIPIINKQSQIMIKKIKMNGNVNDLLSLVTLCSLDIICETIMGVPVNAQNGPDSEYVNAICTIGECFTNRSLNVLSLLDLYYYRTENGKRFLKSLDILHKFTRNVIKNRKCEIINSNKSSNLIENDDSMICRKKRSTLLDFLLKCHLSDSSQFTEEHVREEVDTFMFAGHDTTALGICWTLYFLGLYHDYQQNVYDEINYILNDDRERSITGEDIKGMKYLECCIKEALRLCPSVPLIGRELKNEFQIEGHSIPKGTTILINIFLLHRNSEIFPNPEVYNPNRFLLEESSRLNSFSYIPFSFGPRNCIGQRFALIEEKIIIADVLRNFKIKSLDERDSIKVAHEITLRPRSSIRMQFIKR